MKIITIKTEKNSIKHRKIYKNWVNNAEIIRQFENGKHWYEHAMNNKIYLYIMMREIIETHNNRTRRILKNKGEILLTEKTSSI